MTMMRFIEKLTPFFEAMEVDELAEVVQLLSEADVKSREYDIREAGEEIQFDGEVFRCGRCGKPCSNVHSYCVRCGTAILFKGVRQ